jgi:raffinose synthase
MFQTGHEAGEFHATARAIYGGPIYVSDTPQNHNFNIISKLSTFDGEVFLCCDIAKPTVSCLHNNPFEEDVLFKIFNFNKFGGVIGAFNVQYNAENPKSIKDFIMPSDIVGFEDGDFAVYSHFEKELRKLSANEKFDINLLQIKSELFTVMKIEKGFAPIGLVDKYNSGGAILDMSCEEDGKVTLILKDGGKFVAYCEKTPSDVKVNGAIVDFVYKDNLLLVETATKGKTIMNNSI